MPRSIETTEHKPSDAKLQYAEDTKEMRSLLREMLNILRKSTIFPRAGDSPWSRFWYTYNLEAEEYDREFLQRYQGDMNNTMIFSGLLVAALATFASMTVNDLSPDPNLLMLVLVQNILISVNSTAGTVPQGIPLPAWEGPSVSVVWYQTLLYASLACSLLVALGAVLAAQWLSRYSAVDERGTAEDRCKRRQQKFDGLEAWRFRIFLEALPILLQFSLFLFSVSLCAYMWNQQRIIASVLIALNGLGGLLWAYTVVVSTVYPDSPYDTPLSDLLAQSFKRSSNATASLLRYSRLANTPAGFVGVRRRKIMNFIAQIRSKTTIWWRRALCRSSLEEETDAESHTISHGLPLTETNDVEQTRRRSASRTRFFGPRRAESRSAIARYAQYGAQPIIRANHVILWTLRLLVSPIFTPMVTAHKKRLARSYPSANDVHMAAVLWLLETSTDPEIHVNSMLVAPDVIWTDAMFRSLFPVETLDLYLKQVAACFQGGRLKADSVDQVLSSCSSFLRVFWRMCQIDRGQATTDAWSRTSGATFVETYPAIMTALQSVELKDYARPAGEVWILRYMHLTLEHLCDASKPQNALISVNFPAETSSGASQLKNTTLSPNAPFTASFQFRTSNLLYLSYLSFQHAWVVPHCIVLLSEIQEYSASGGSSVDVQHFSLLATALLLGFEPTGDLADFLVTPEWSRQRGWRAAADYVLTELYSFLQWKWSGPRETPSIAWVFVVSKYDRLGSESLIVLTKIIHILRFATEILSKTWVMPSFYSAPLTVFATKLCSSRDTVGLEAVCQGVTDVMMLLSRTVEHAGYQDFDANEALRVILETAATLRLSSTGRLTRPAHPPHSDSFFLMQQTAFSIIQSSIARGHYRPTDVPSFSTDTCRWEVSHPGALDVSTIGEEDHVRISERDFSFIAVICAIKEATDSSDRADACTWFEDVQSVPLMRLWARIAHCWLIPIKSDAFSSEKVRRLSLEMLLDCERFRLPERSTWGEDLSVVQQVAFVTLWKNWATALARAAAGQDVDFSKLAESTRCVLAGMEMRDAAELEWYIRDTLEDTFPRQLMDIRERGVVDPSLAVVESLLAEKLDEIQRFKNTGLDGVRDTVNKIKKHTNISVVGKVPDERHTASSRKEQEEVQAPVVLDALDARETSMANTEGSDVVGKVENEVRSADCT